MSEQYLGDGLYVSDDGFEIRLRAPRPGGDHEVFLDRYVLANFLEWLAQARGIRSSMPSSRRADDNSAI